MRWSVHMLVKAQGSLAPGQATLPEASRQGLSTPRCSAPLPECLVQLSDLCPLLFATLLLLHPGHLCRTRPTDLVFVVDSSRSVRPVEFEKVKVFLSQVIESLNVGPNATRVGVVNYASSVKQEFPLRAHLSKAALLQAVRRIRPLSTGTMTGLAIQFAITKALSDAEGGRAKSPDISKVHAPFPPPCWGPPVCRLPLGAESFACMHLNSPNAPARRPFTVWGAGPAKSSGRANPAFPTLRTPECT